MSHASTPHAKALITEPNMASPDDFYEALIHAHRDLDETQSHALNAKLVLLLANHVGSQPVIAQALQAARSSTLANAIISTVDGPNLDSASQHATKT
jgi:hypothetical protein